MPWLEWQSFAGKSSMGNAWRFGFVDGSWYVSLPSKNGQEAFAVTGFPTIQDAIDWHVTFLIKSIRAPEESQITLLKAIAGVAS